ncbi:AAEL014621-PA [Aedes aegypti]|uniref:AAEL014621-PA n=1 Tax=Aedes aegypti TaxID=7159 RepID=Q16FV6_AEDAE|nr:AAEL014621-PA [Aedes aegypti]
MDTQEANPPVAECASAGDQYHQLLALDKQDLVRNEEPNPCNLCDAMTPAGSGVVLFNCLHSFCIGCLKTSLRVGNSTGCPFPNARYECVGNLEQRELEALLNAEEYQLLMKRRQNSLKSISDSLQKERTDSLPAELKLLVTLTDSILFGTECRALRVSHLLRRCLANSIKHAQDVEVRCPFKDRNASCETVIQDQEIRSLLSKHDYSVYLKRSLEQAEISITGAFHCKTPNCLGWCILEIQDSVTVFQCPICSAQNCLLCELISFSLARAIGVCCLLPT